MKEKQIWHHGLDPVIGTNATVTDDFNHCPFAVEKDIMAKAIL